MTVPQLINLGLSGFALSGADVGGFAGSPSPEEVGQYEVNLPPGVWFDYWTGERLDRRIQTTARDLEQRDAKQSNKPLLITPKLADLPVYVREGAILPIAPLTQSTNETPA